MKTKNLLVVMSMVGAMFSFNDSIAQGRGNAYGHDKQEWRRDDRNSPRNNPRDDDRDRQRDNWNDRDHHRDNRWDDRYERDRNDRNWHGNRYTYHRPPHWAPSRGHYNQSRYVYYRDYNVYYDCYRDVYITCSGRNYIYSNNMPPHMRRANFDRIVFVDLDFYDDDLPKYLDRRGGNVSVSVQGRF